MSVETQAGQSVQAETVLIPPVADEVDSGYAWSVGADAESVDEPSRRHRVLTWAAVVIALVAAVTAVVWFSLQYESQERSVAAPVPVVVPVVVPAPSPMIDVTTSRPPRPLQFDDSGVPMIPKDPTSVELNRVFLADLDHFGVPYENSHGAIIDAQNVCEYLKSGHRNLSDEDAWVKNMHPNFTRDQVDWFGGASTGAYCPQYDYLASPDADGSVTS